MAGARRASCGGHTPSACESREPGEARGLGHQLQADTREQAGLLSGPQAEAFLLPELLLALVLGARRAGSLSFGNDRDCEGYHTNPRQSSFRTFSCGKAKLHRFSNTALGRRPSSATSDPPPILGKLPHLRGPHFCHLYPTRRAAAPTCAAAGTVRDGSGSLPAAGRRGGGRGGRS